MVGGMRNQWRQGKFWAELQHNTAFFRPWEARTGDMTNLFSGGKWNERLVAFGDFWSKLRHYDDIRGKITAM